MAKDSKYTSGLRWDGNKVVRTISFGELEQVADTVLDALNSLTKGLAKSNRAEIELMFAELPETEARPEWIRDRQDHCKQGFWGRLGFCIRYLFSG